MAIKDIAINSGTNDIDISGISLYFNEGRRAVAQRIRIKFGTYQGEWFLNKSIGVPYQSQVLVKSPNIENISALIRKIILDTEGISSLEEFAISYSSGLRSMSVSFVANTTEQEIISSVATATTINPGLYLLLFDLPSPSIG